MSPSEFERGVNWGKFTVAMYDDDPKTEAAMLAVLEAVVDYMREAPDPTLIEKMTDAWFDSRCHGTLAAGAVCQRCCAVNPGDDS